MASSNKVHVNNSTRISLNDRFTIMQSVGVPSSPSGNPNHRNNNNNASPSVRHPRSRSRSRSRSVGRMTPTVAMTPIVTSPRVHPRMASVSPRSRMARHYPADHPMMDSNNGRQRLMARAQQLRNAALARTATAKQRLALSMRRGNGSALRRQAMRAQPTMRMDQLAAAASSARGPRGSSRRGQSMMMMTTATMLRQRRLSRAMATVNQTRLSRSTVRGRGGVPANGVNSVAVNRRSRLELARSLSKANLVRDASRGRSRSRSRARAMAAPAQSNLRRSNSRLNLNQAAQQQQQQQQPRRKLIRDFQQRSRSRSRQSVPSIASRLGVRPQNANNGGRVGNQQPAGQQRQRSNSRPAGGARGGRPSVLNRVNQGRVSKQQRLGRRSIGNANAASPAKKNQRGRGKVANNGGGNQRGRTPQRNNKTGGVQQRLTLQRPGAGRVQQQQQQQRKNNNNQQKQAKGRRGKRGIRPGAAAKGPVKKEDLDKELDKYMSSTKPNNLY